MRNKVVLLLGITMLAAMYIAGNARGESPHSKAVEPETVTVTGQIVDPVCLLSMGESGPDHASCARACAKMGINMAFYNEKDGKIYMIFPSGHADPNAKVLDYLEKRVEIRGTIHAAAGYQGIEIQSIKELGEGKKITLQ
jgi:hypothetical protein